MTTNTHPELPPMPEPFEHLYEFASPFGGVERRTSPNQRNGSGPKQAVPVFTADQMRTYALLCRNAALEEAAKTQFTKEQCIYLLAAALYINARDDENCTLDDAVAERISEFLVDLSGINLDIDRNLKENGNG